MIKKIQEELEKKREHLLDGLIEEEEQSLGGISIEYIIRRTENHCLGIFNKFAKSGEKEK